MVHSSDNNTALYQEPVYLQVKEMVCVRIRLPIHEPFLGWGWALAGNGSASVERLHDNFM